MEAIPNTSSAHSVVGVWYDKDLKCTYSIEKVENSYFKGSRCSDGSGGTHGLPLTQIKPNTFAYNPSRSTGDYFVILSNGSLELRDRQGYIRTLPKHSKLWP